jgi:hypothetical protein
MYSLLKLCVSQVQSDVQALSLFTITTIINLYKVTLLISARCRTLNLAKYLYCLVARHNKNDKTKTPSYKYCTMLKIKADELNTRVPTLTLRDIKNLNT